MAAFYGNRIRAGIMTLEEVPKLWRKKTELWLQNTPQESRGLEK